MLNLGIGVRNLSLRWCSGYLDLLLDFVLQICEHFYKIESFIRINIIIKAYFKRGFDGVWEI